MIGGLGRLGMLVRVSWRLSYLIVLRLSESTVVDQPLVAVRATGSVVWGSCWDACGDRHLAKHPRR
jgi:hypothetical protein